MEEARQAVDAFMAKNGHHDTSVHEKVAPAVRHETFTKTEHEEITSAVDREIHQDHYHISIQPITEEEYLTEQHHNLVEPVELQNFEHDDIQEVKRRLADEAAKFKDEIFFETAERTHVILPRLEGVHYHHHVHETIQPVINKHVYEPHIYHVIKQLHEIHHNAALHHTSSSLPAVSMVEFKKQGGVLTGREERYDAFEGEPRSVGKAMAGKTSAPTTSSGTTEAPASHAAAPSKTAGVSATAQPAKTSVTATKDTAAGKATPATPAAPAAPAESTAAPPAAPSRVPTGLSREIVAAGGAPHPLMRPPTTIPTHAYADGHGSGPPRRIHFTPHPEPEGSAPAPAPTAGAAQPQSPRAPTGGPPTDKPLPREP